MTIKEAIEKIKYRIDTAKSIVGSGEDGKAFEDLEMGIKALEKQIPKKLLMADVGYTIYGCPNCDYTDTLWSLKKRDKHCPNCGQKLDWGNEE